MNVKVSLVISTISIHPNNIRKSLVQKWNIDVKWIKYFLWNALTHLFSMHLFSTLKTSKNLTVF